jgi:hypothetical protein
VLADFTLLMHIMIHAEGLVNPKVHGLKYRN